jgi:superfamily I DNA/RNA helicase
MFRLANMIAYDGKMIMGRGEKIPVVENFGASSWLHVTGEAVGQRRHWVKEQGEVAFRLMQAVALDPALASADAAAKNVYVISPFREVVREFSKFILSQDPLPGHLTINSRWCRENVGTIHTFQGKEADVVIMILGLDEVKRYAAQTMVDYKPNLLNVAATRAKKHFFIIGDRHLWEPVYSFDSAAKILPVIEINDHPLLADKWPVSPAREIHHVPQSVHEHETATIRS